MSGVILHCELDAREATQQEYEEIVGSITDAMLFPGNIKAYFCAVPQSKNFYLNYRFFEQTGFEVVGPVFFESDNHLIVEKINQMFPRHDEGEESD